MEGNSKNKPEIKVAKPSWKEFQNNNLYVKKNNPISNEEKLKIKPEIVINIKESLECLMMPSIPMSKSV